MFSSGQAPAKAVQLLQHIRKPVVQLSVRHRPFPSNFNTMLRNIPVPECSKLQNGLTVATELRDIPHACIGLCIDGGTRYESTFENGITHFFEHIAFKGTKQRNKSCLHQLMSSTGARFRCFTTREIVVYYAQCLASDAAVIIDILIDCIYNNSFCHKDIEEQKHAVYCEMLEHDNDPNEILFDYLHAAAFQGTQMAQSVQGPAGNLYNFTETIVANLISKRFNPARAVLAFVGPLTHDCVEHLVCTACSQAVEPCIAPYDPYRFTAGDFRFRDDSMPLANCAIAFEGPSLCDDDTYVLDVAAAYLGGWDYSQPGTRDNAHALAQASHAHNLCHAYQPFNIKYKDCGLWGIQFLGDRLHLDEMVYNIQTQFMKLCTSVTDNEIKRAKRELKTHLLTQLESAENSCHDLGRWVLYNGFRPPLYQRLNMIEHVRACEVQDICTKYLYDRDPVVAAVGPCESLPDYVRIRSGQYWLRL